MTSLNRSRVSVETVNDHHESDSEVEQHDEKNVSWYDEESIEHQMKAFQDDLDAITKSIEEDTEFVSLMRQAKQPDRVSKMPHPHTPILRRSRQPCSGTKTTGAASLSSAPPPPMQTPAPHLFSPETEDFPSVAGLCTNTLNTSGVSLDPDLLFPTKNNIENRWKQEYEKMHTTLKRHEARIYALEDENQQLRLEVRRLRSFMDEFSFPRSGSSQTDTCERSYSPRWPIRGDQVAGLSPGALFVDDLANVIDLDANYRGPLASAMDKYFTRQAKSSASLWD